MTLNKEHRYYYLYYIRTKLILFYLKRAIILLLRIAVTFLSELRADVRINLAKLEPF